MSIKATDFLGRMILIQGDIQKLRQELTVDVCENNPQLVLLSLDGIQLRVNELVGDIVSKDADQTTARGIRWML